MDLEDIDFENFLYSLINGQYNVYSDCIKGLDVMIEKPSDMALKYFIGWVMKLETKTAAPRKIDIMNLALF